jgi:hypothetical protein
MFKRIEISNIGPLKDLDIDLGQCNLIIGRNESGKTTIADLLASRLAGIFKGKNQVKEFQKITGVSLNRFGGNWKARVSGDPDGLVDDVGAKEALVDVLSLLVIRANRNEVVNKDKADIASLDFWRTTVKNMLAGSSVISKKISAIKTYTNTGAKVWKIKDHLESYLALLLEKKGELDAFRKSMASSGQDSDALRSIDRRLEEAKKIRDAQEFKKRLVLYNRYMETRSCIASIEEGRERYDIGELLKKSAAWQETDERLKEREKSGNETRLNRVKIAETLAGIERNMRARIGQKDELEKRLAGKTNTTADKKDYESERARLNREKAEAEKAKKKLPIGPLIVLLLGIVLLPCILFFFPFVFVSAALIILGFALFFVMKAKIEKESSLWIEEILARIIENESQAKTFEATLKGELCEADRLRAEIKKIDLEIRSEEERAKAAKRTIDALSEKEKQINLGIEASKKEIGDFIVEFKDRTYLGGLLEEINSRQKTLARYKADLSGIEKDIRSAFGVDSIIPSDLLARIELERGRISEEFLEKAFDPKKYDELLGLRESIVKKGHGYDKEFAEMKGSAVKELEAGLKKAKEVSSKDMSGFYSVFFADTVESLRVDSVYDLDPVIELCRQAIGQTGRYRDYAEYLYSAVNSMESKQDSLIRSVTDDSGFRNAIKHIMGYSRIESSIDDDGVNFSFGDEGFPLADLSTGALHQFNLVFRFAMLHRIFKSPATIVLDDAFLHFDRERRKRACEILLRDFAEKGWQFVYTAIDDGAIESVFRSVFPEGRLVVKKIG